MTKTINGLTVTTSAAAGDLIAIWRTANADTRKITKADFLGGVLTGAGTIATGGFTGTLPATGTLSLLGTAQAFSALNTFNAGISLGNETLSIYDQGTWVPAITTGGVSVTYSTQTGQYTRIGNVVIFSLIITIATISGSGNLVVTLPITAAALAWASVRTTGIDVPGTAIGLVAQINAGTAVFNIYTIEDNGGGSLIDVGNMAAGDNILATGVYFV